MPQRRHQQRGFEYQSLSQHEFRLLRLHRGTGERVVCSIEHYDLDPDSCPSYNAVSYTWGNGAERCEIYLDDGCVMKIRANLRNALQSMRNEVTDTLLWIDAICKCEAQSILSTHGCLSVPAAGASKHSKGWIYCPICSRAWLR